jgi:hypothetical protein
MRVFILYYFFFFLFLFISLYGGYGVFGGRDKVRVFWCYPSFLLFYTLAPCPFSSVFLFFIFSFFFWVLCFLFKKQHQCQFDKKNNQEL